MYVRCLWKSKTPEELGGGVEGAEDTMGSTVGAESCLTSKSPPWKDHQVSHVSSQPHCPQVLPAVQLN